MPTEDTNFDEVFEVEPRLRFAQYITAYVDKMKPAYRDPDIDLLFHGAFGRYSMGK